MDSEEAVEAFRQQVIIAPGEPVGRGCLGWALGLAGQRQEAQTILGDLERQRNESYVMVPCWPGSVWGWATMIKPSPGYNKPPKTGMA